MKKIILSLIVMAFAVAVQAGDAKTTQAKDQNQPACCGGKTKTSMQTKEGTCPMVKTSMQTKEGTCPMAKGTCCKQTAVKQTALLSPKAAGAVR